MRLLGFVVGVAATLAMMHAGAACSSFTQQDAPELDGEAGTDGSDGEPLDADGDAADSADAAPPYTVLAQNMADLEGIDANENHAFVVQKSIGAVSAILLAGSTTTTQISTGGPAQSPSAILAFSDNIVWADYGHPGLATFALDGGVAASPIAPNDGLGPSAIARAACRRSPRGRRPLLEQRRAPDSCPPRPRRAAPVPSANGRARDRSRKP